MRSYRQTSLVGRSYAKLDARYFGPFKIISQEGDVAYKLKLPPSSRNTSCFSYFTAQEGGRGTSSSSRFASPLRNI